MNFSLYNNFFFQRNKFNDAVLIIAEIGVNHNGQVSLAKDMILEAKSCGADCIKFQTFKASRVASNSAPKATYQLGTTDSTESQLAMLHKLELSEADYRELAAFCDKHDVVFLSTPYDVEDADFLDEIGVQAFKVASGQAIETRFLQHLARKGKPILLSTGMCTLAEVDEAVRTIRKEGNYDIVVLQCTTNYPSAIQDSNLLAMRTMAESLGVLVGYSDHTKSLTAAVAAVALGARVVERHFTLDKSLPGPDHSSSSEPHEFRMMVEMIRETELALGSPRKEPTLVEIENAKGMRRSLTARRDIRTGEKLDWDSLTLKRPGTGINGSSVNLVLGRSARRDIPADTILTLDMIE